jgi:hypothetical protein
MAGTSPAMTKKRIIFKEPENVGCIFAQALRSRSRRISSIGASWFETAQARLLTIRRNGVLY